MPIYSLNKPLDLLQDVENVINKIEQYYSFTNGVNKSRIFSKVILDPEIYAYSDEGHAVFNKLILEITGLHIQMYHLIEKIAIAKSNTEFSKVKPILNVKFPLFDLFRQFTNKIKHNNTPDIEVTCITFFEGGMLVDGKMYGQITRMEVSCDFKKEQQSILYFRFIELFYSMLEHFEIITITQT